MEITRNQIEIEENYKKLQAIGRAFRKEGHKLILNVPEDELKAWLLNIFDNHYAKDDSEPEPENADVTDIVEGAIADVEVVSEPENTEETIEEPDPEIVTEVEKPKDDLYISQRAYKDWASKWSFTPGMDKPKPLPKKLTPGLVNAIKTKKIIPYEG